MQLFVFSGQKTVHVFLDMLCTLLCAEHILTHYYFMHFGNISDSLQDRFLRRIDTLEYQDTKLVGCSGQQG